MATEQDWRDGSKYYLSPEQESAVKMRSIARYGADTQSTVCMEEIRRTHSGNQQAQALQSEDPTNMVGRNELIENLYEEMADALICFDLLVEIYSLKPSDLRRMIDHKVWRMKQKMEAQGEKF